MTEIHIRPATVEDLEEVALLVRDMADDGWWKGKPVQLTKVFAIAQHVVEAPTVCLLVAEHKDLIVGVFMGEITQFLLNDRQYAEEILIFVQPSYRAAGIARRLLESWMAWAKERGAAEVYFAPSMDPDKPNRWDALTHALGMTKTGCNYRKVLTDAAA
jgi:GNAT superfamily N-acetyltransferase